MTFMKIDWEASGENIYNLRDIISSMGYKNPSTLMVRMCLAMIAGLPGGLKNDTQIFAGAKFQDILQRNYQKIQSTISDVLIFIDNFIKQIPSFKLPSFNPVLILARYRYIHGRTRWVAKRKKFEVFLFAAFLSRVLSRPTQDLMKALLKYAKDYEDFDLKSIENICIANHKSIKLDVEELLKNTKIKENIASLLMYFVYYGKKDYRSDLMIQKDHIFPEAALKNFRDDNGQNIYTQNDYDDISNCAMLTKDQNNQKTDQLPERYFYGLKYSGKLNKFLSLHEIPKPDSKGFDIWSLNQFRAFIEQRRNILYNVISSNFQRLGII